MSVRSDVMSDLAKGVFQLFFAAWVRKVDYVGFFFMAVFPLPVNIVQRKALDVKRRGFNISIFYTDILVLFIKIYVEFGRLGKAANRIMNC